MVTTNSDASGTANREIRLSRAYDAPREVVWDAWTDPEQVVQWWGPNGFTTTTLEIDVRAGGRWRYIMHGPDGVDYPNLQEYDDVVRPERIAGRHSDDIESTARVVSATLGSNLVFHSAVTFEDRDGKTEVTLVSVFASAEVRDRMIAEWGVIEGGEQTLARLAEHLARR